MGRTGLWLRVFVGLLLAVIPPILILAGSLLLAESVFAATDPSVVATFVIVASIVWATILAIVYTRSLGEDLRSMVALARQGQAGEEALDTAQEQLARALDERNRQVSEIAIRSRLIPMEEEPRAAVAAVISSVHAVLADPTWRLAVLSSSDAGLLPSGVYRAGEPTTTEEAIGDTERWAAVTGDGAPVRHADGPWGAFTIIDVSAGDRLRAILYAPWEGRNPPSPADTSVLRLVGQLAGTALDHALLFAKVRLQSDELNRMAAVQSDFLRGVTHDLQTPLTSIGALATELRANAGLPESARGDLDTITHQAERLRRMVGQLLVASRLEAGAVVPRQEVFAIQPLIERTWGALRADRQFNLETLGAPHLVVADPDRTEQVMWAVLDNAVKYSPPGSSIAVRIRPDGQDRLRVEVADHGAGMDAQTQRHAFDQFYRATGARAMAPDGSGVGLYAARGLVEAMGGSIELESRLGAGTTVRIRLPAEAVADAEAPTSTQ